ncbi:hypothetical protein BC332_24830 [Capsicum chinense]|nr:hypothetical protein BC332_24830 [Capsicum chinense]
MAHASVASLMRTIQSLLTFNSPMQSLICDHRDEFCALHEKVSSLEIFLKNFEKFNVSGEMMDFEVEVKNNMVGRDDQRERLVEHLTRSYSGEPKVIPIVGMGGIGKTTLVNEVYNDACICSHFDVCAWATISQQHNIKEILLSLLRSTKSDTFDMNDEAELANMMQKSLKENLSLQMGFMDLDDSWNLFKSTAFVNEALPYEFETVGKQIADECHGLPLTIVVVAGLLKSKRAIEDWGSVAKDVKSFVTNDPEERCSRVLGLSYDHLTSDLKTYLLTKGVTWNVKKLGIRRDGTYSGPLNNLVLLHQLETLNFIDSLGELLPASAKAFPATLKKLKLKATGLSLSYLDIIAEFPNLEVLKLMDNACLGNEWYPNVRGFTRLKVALTM